MQESNQVMQGTKHADDWYFYHDALSQLTAKDMQNWLVEKGYKERWLLPLIGLIKGTVDENRPIGDSLEMMPLDNSLFEDLHAEVCRHAAQTVLLPLEDPEKFSLANPKEVARAYLRLWDHMLPTNEGCPCSSRIVEDCTKFVSNIRVIYDAKGIMVSGVGNRNGHCRDTAAGTGKIMEANEKRNHPRNTPHGSIQMQWMG
jgi:hypothetical protein